MSSPNRLKQKLSTNQKLIVTSIAAALGLTGVPLAVGQEKSLEEVIVTCASARRIEPRDSNDDSKPVR